MSHREAQLVSGYLSIWFLAASFLTWYLIERVGRRPLLMIFCVAMAIAMAILAAMIEVGTYKAGIAAAAVVFLYEAFFTWGWMGNVWCYTAEIIPLDCRSKGMGFAVGCQWVWNFVMIYVTPIGISNIHWKMYIGESAHSTTQSPFHLHIMGLTRYVSVFAAFNLAFAPIIYTFFPETSGLSLELLDAVFMDKTTHPVKKAAEFRRRVRAGERIAVADEVEAAAVGDGKAVA
jgi:hypothetical protein